MNYAERVSESRRTSILRLLERTHDQPPVSESTIQIALERFDVRVSIDQVRTALAWLEEQELVTCEDLDGLMLAKITKRGIDVAVGRARVPGVKRPSRGL